LYYSLLRDVSITAETDVDFYPEDFILSELSSDDMIEFLELLHKRFNQDFDYKQCSSLIRSEMESSFNSLMESLRSSGAYREP
jgi:hypothetical protein